MTVHADLLLTNGRIIADAGAEVVVEAIAVAGTRVVAAGTREEVAAQVPSDIRTVDLGGRTVVPGLIDSHLHLVRAGLSWLDEVFISHVRSIPELLDVIREKSATPSQAGWVAIVGGWSPGQLEERRFPTLAELDEAAPDVPVYMQFAYDRAMVNSAAIRLVALDQQEQLGDAIQRDEAGALTGVMFGKKAYAYCLGFALEADDDRKIESTVAMFKEYVALGLTGGVDTGGGARMGPEAYRPMMEVARRGQMPFKARLYVHPHGHDEMSELEEYLRQLHPGFGNDTIAYSGIGEIVLHNCYDGAGFDHNFTIDEPTKELLYQATMKCAELNWPVNIHAVHDATLKTMLDVWERVDKTYPLADRRFSISHGDGASLDSLKRIKALGAGITVQDRLTIRSVETALAWGDERTSQSPPLRDMIDLGIPIGGGTDATVAGPFNPWIALSFFITGQPIDNGPRRVAEQCLTRLEALEAYTSGSAWFSREEDTRGKLLPGYAADLAVLTEDYLSVPDDRIEHIRSVLTLVNGAVVHTDAAIFPELPNGK